MRDRAQGGHRLKLRKQKARQHPVHIPIPGTVGTARCPAKSPGEGMISLPEPLPTPGRKVPARGRGPRGLRTGSTTTSRTGLGQRAREQTLWPRAHQGAQQRRPAAPARRRPRRNTARGSSLRSTRWGKNGSLPGPRASSPPGRDGATRGLQAGRRAASSLLTQPGSARRSHPSPGAPPPPQPPAPDSTHRAPAPPPRGPAAGLQGESGSAVPGTLPTVALAPAPEAPSEAPDPAQAEQPPPPCPGRPA